MGQDLANLAHEVDEDFFDGSLLLSPLIDCVEPDPNEEESHRIEPEYGHIHDAHFVAGDSEHLPFESDSFDFLTCSNSFHHYPDQQAVVIEFRRVLKPGGHLLLIDGFRDNVVGWVTFDVIIASVEEQNVYHAPWSVIHEYFETAGFSEIRRRKFGFWLPGCLTIGTA